MEPAQFEVIKVDPEGSGIDYSGHLGATITNAKRCCPRCTCIFGRILSNGKVSDGEPIGPFIQGELRPLNESAIAIQKEIEDFVASKREIHAST